MRPIDADDFLKQSSELYEHAGWDEREVHFSLAGLRCNLEMMPTVEAEPEHGHWIISGEWCTCSECKQSLHYERSKGKSNLINALSMAVNFCPNCGAKMDGEVERETD